MITLPRIRDPRGSLTPIEGGAHVPFEIQRVYWIYDVPSGELRGGHAYLRLEEFFVALSGSFDVVLYDGATEERITLNRAYSGLYVPRLVWRSLENFSTNAVCLIVASRPYEEDDYIRDPARFRELGAASG
jgi:dTDP-4-dehydrorhamnose 3,5-epimerase-like enzyme